MRRIEGQDDLTRAMRDLQTRDPAIARAVEAGARPDLRLRPQGFAALLEIIVSQQLSTASAAAIWRKLGTTVNPMTPARLLQTDTETLRSAGLGRAKSRYAHALAEALETGTLDLADIPAISAEKAVTRLTQVNGIGPWTAEIYLLFCTGHPDIFPAGDLALRESIRLLHGLGERPQPQHAYNIAEAWRPWRGVAARLLWDYYRIAKPVATRSNGRCLP